MLDNKLIYFVVGEYGTHTKRPHYHALLFNTGINSQEVLLNLIYLAWTNEKGESKGFAHCGNVTMESIRYVAGYMEKGIDGEVLDENIQREFNLMSKGIGKEYIKHNFYYHQENEKFTYKNGKKDEPLPRYYKERIFSDADRQAYVEKVEASIPKRTPTEEKNNIRARIERIRALNNLKSKRK